MAGYTCHSGSCGFNGTVVQVFKHSKKVHVSDRNDIIACFICSGRLYSYHLLRHIRRCHPGDLPVRCYICNEAFFKDADMRSHVKGGCRKNPERVKPSLIIGDDMYPHLSAGCKTGKRRGKKKAGLGSALAGRKTRKPRVWPCDMCSKRLRSEKGVQEHTKNVHGSSASIVSPTYASAIPADFNSFLNDCRPKDVHSYISQHLQTDESFRDECSRVVDRVADFFKGSAGYTVNRFIKGGSLGKGTAIKSKSDIDCVMFISELPPIDNDGDDYFDKLQVCLKKMEKILRTANFAYNLEVVGRTRYAVKLRVQTKKADHEPHDVDLLPTNDLLGAVPTNAKKEKVYSMMADLDPADREHCSAALVKLQLDFVKKQPAEVKDLIRLVKMWKLSCVTEPSLTSYPLELLCIHTWPSHGNVAAAFKAVLKKLSDYGSIHAYWTDNYSFHRVQTMLRKRPLILDPANPYNNVADRCRNWDAVARAAEESLGKPFFSCYWESFYKGVCSPTLALFDGRRAVIP